MENICSYNIDKFNIKYNKINGYIQLSSIANTINKAKMNKKLYRFFNKDFEKVCFNIENSDDYISIVCKESLSHVKFDKNTELIYRQLLWTGNVSLNSLTGYYAHPELLIYFINWLDKSWYGTAIKIVNNIYSEILVTNELFGLYYKSFVNKLREEIKIKSELLEIMEISLKRANERASVKKNNYGSIVIKNTENPTIFRINGFNYESLQTKNNTVIRTFGAKDNFEIFKDYICKNDVEYVKLIKNNDFEITDKDKTFKLIDDLISKNIPVHERNSSGFDEEFEMLLNLYNKNQNAYNRGKLFEYICADKFGAILWKNLTKYYLYTFGLTNQDIGIDLVDIEHKILYQCKNYKTKLNTSNINSFRRTLNIFKSIDDEYVGKIICDKATIVAKNVLDEFEIIRLDLDEELQ